MSTGNSNESCDYAKLRAENASLKEVISLSEDSRLMDEYLKLERVNTRQAERIAELEAEIERLRTEVSNLTSQLLEADEFVAELQDRLER